MLICATEGTKCYIGRHDIDDRVRWVLSYQNRKNDNSSSYVCICDNVLLGGNNMLNSDFSQPMMMVLHNDEIQRVLSGSCDVIDGKFVVCLSVFL